MMPSGPEVMRRATTRFTSSSGTCSVQVVMGSSGVCCCGGGRSWWSSLSVCVLLVPRRGWGLGKIDAQHAPARIRVLIRPVGVIKRIRPLREIPEGPHSLVIGWRDDLRPPVGVGHPPKHGVQLAGVLNTEGEIHGNHGR